MISFEMAMLAMGASALMLASDCSSGGDDDTETPAEDSSPTPLGVEPYIVADPYGLALVQEGGEYAAVGWVLSDEAVPCCTLLCGVLLDEAGVDRGEGCDEANEYPLEVGVWLEFRISFGDRGGLECPADPELGAPTVDPACAAFELYTMEAAE